MCRLSLFFLLILGATRLFADGITHYEEPGLSAYRAYSGDHYAENIDPFTGNLSLQFVDLVIPGNGGFDLKVQRSYNSNLVQETASPLGRGWQLHFGRVRHSTLAICGGAAPQTMALELPDGSRHTLYIANGIGSTSIGDYLTTSLWKGRCSSTGPGITLSSPDGTSYEMSEADGPYWHATRITDRFGNRFDLTYAANSTLGVKVISEVRANDGRTLNFSYSGGKLTSISGGGRTWQYSVANAADGSFKLASVSPPAGGVWNFDYNGSSGAGAYALQRVISPFGGAISYSYTFVDFFGGAVDMALPITAVSQKSVGSDTWRFSYTPGCPSATNDVTTVTLPDSIGQITYRHFGYCGVASGAGWKIGLLYEKKSGSVQTETFEWAGHAISNEDTVRPGYNKFDTEIIRPLLSERNVTRDGLAHTTRFSGFDSFGNPGDVSESGSHSRSRSISYYNNSSKWIVGLVGTESITGIGSITRSRNSTTGALTTESRFGVATDYSYQSDGSVSYMTTDKPATTSYSSYMYGVARSENRPEGVSISRSVDGIGKITSQSDGEYTWGYDYDAIGRLTRIDFPRGLDALISWGTRSRTMTRGELTEVTDFDAFGRTTSITREGIRTRFEYDALGRKVFESLPGSSDGIDFDHDILGRVTLQQSPAGIRRFYYSGDSVTVTDERGKSTQFEYYSYGDPDTRDLRSIVPLTLSSAKVTMSRNDIGLLLSATQNGVTRTYGYNSSYFLTSIAEPETSQNTTFGRDRVGNMISKSAGGKTVNYSYDDLSRLTSISGVGVSASFDYDDRGKVIAVDNGAAARNYSYDANGNLTEDQLLIDGRSFIVKYSYDLLDGLTAITYPMSKGSVTYSPNPLGRPTSVLPFATSVSHHDSGNLSSISFANGVTQAMGENGRQLPTTISAGAIQLGLTYGYDSAGNVSSISNSYFSDESRQFEYDGINRLTNANGPWGYGSVNYDGGGNITQQKFGSYQMDYSYSNNRVSSIGGSKVASFTYDSAGNMTGNGAATFNFDALSQLDCVNCGTASEIRYQYDGQGRRVSEDRNGYRTYFVQAPNGDLQFAYATWGKAWTVNAFLHGKRIASEVGSDALGTAMAASATPASGTYGDSITLTATISPSAATGSIEFIDGDRSLGMGIIANGLASIQVADLAVGTRSITARYGGDANYQPAGGTVTVSIAKRAAVVALESTAPAVSLGQAVTLSAHVTGSAPSGTVRFFDGGVLRGSRTLGADGKASLSTPPLSGGSHAFTVQYDGDAIHEQQSSSPVSVIVARGQPTTDLALSAARSTMGHAVSLTATVSGLAGFAPGGTVEFKEGANVIGTGTLSAGTATLSTSALYAGTRRLTATYVGDANYLDASSAAVYHDVATTTLDSVIHHTVREFDLNPRRDLAWRKAGSLHGIWLSNGAGFTPHSVVGPTGATTVLAADLDADGRSDLVWRRADGSYAISIMNGGAMTSTTDVLATGSGWEAVGHGDFSGDGKADLVWKHVNGGYGVWMMDGAVISSASALSLPSPGARVAVIADFNGDGKSDLQWRASDGSVRVDIMDGGSVVASGPTIAPGTTWVQTHVGDFNADGKADIVWRKSDGQHGIWLMDGANMPAFNGLTTPGTGWRVAAVGDMDADGRTDLLWSDDHSGFSIYLMNGAVPSSMTAIPEDPSWAPIMLADFDGDGDDDLLLRKGDGRYQTWMMQGATVGLKADVLGPATGWEAAP